MTTDVATVVHQLTGQRQEAGRRIITTACELTFTARPGEKVDAVTGWRTDVTCDACRAARGRPAPTIGQLPNHPTPKTGARQ